MAKPKRVVISEASGAAGPSPARPWAGFLAALFQVALLAPASSGQIPEGRFRIDEPGSLAPLARETVRGGSGSFLVFWSERNDPDDPSSRESWGRRFRSTGAPVGSRFPVPAFDDLAASPWGGFLAVSDAPTEDGSRFDVYARAHDPSGRPGDAVVRVNELPSASRPSSPPAVAAVESGYLVAWVDDATGRILVRRVDAAGEPAAEPRAVAEVPAPLFAIGASEGGRHAVVSWATEEKSIGARRLSASGLPVGEEIEVAVDVPVSPAGPIPPGLAVEAAGGFLVTWDDRDPETFQPRILSRSFDFEGRALGPPRRLDPPQSGPVSSRSVASVVALPGGVYVATWEERRVEGVFSSGFSIHGRAVAPDGGPAGRHVRVDGPRDDGRLALPGGAAVLPDGRFVVTWSALRTRTFEPPTEIRATVFDGNHLERLVLAGRFSVEVDALDASGERREAAGSRLGDRAAAFWLGRPTSPDVVVKIVDACEAFGATWIFVAGLTDLAVEVRVEDLDTGRTAAWENAAGRAFEPVFDLSTFAGCS